MRKMLVPAFVLSFLFFNCKKDPEILQVSNLSQGRVGVFGHGGMGISSLLPIDSKESLLEALSLGADGTEMDLQMSSDSVLFLFHASDLSENTNCSGSIRKMSAAEINCAYKTLKSGTFQLSSARDFLKTVSDTSFIFTFECKNYDLEPQDFPVMARAVARLVKEFNLKSRTFVESTIPELLLEMRRADAGLKLFLYAEQIDAAIQKADELGFYGVTFDFKRITKEKVAEAHAKNLRVTLFNQQSKSDNLKTLEMNPDFMQTDQLEHLLTVTGNR